MKILSIQYGDENDKINIDHLSIEQINEIKEILLNAAIELTIDITSINFPIEATHIEYILPENNVDRMGNEPSLEDYTMIIRKNNKKYDISFQIVIVN